MMASTGENTQTHAKTKAPTPPAVQDTWIDLQTIRAGCLGFSDPSVKKQKRKRPDATRYICIIEVTGMNLQLFSVEDQARTYDAYQRFLNGLGFPLQILSQSSPIDVRTYAPLLQLERQAAALSSTPRLAALAQQNLQFLRRQLAASMQVRHFVIVGASASEELLRGVNGKPPSLFTILFSFSWLRKRTPQTNEQVIQQVHIRAGAVCRGLTEIGGVQVRPIIDPNELAGLFAASLTHGVNRSLGHLGDRLGTFSRRAA